MTKRSLEIGGLGGGGIVTRIFNLFKPTRAVEGTSGSSLILSLLSLAKVKTVKELLRKQMSDQPRSSWESV